MNIYIELLWQTSSFQETMCRDGWMLEIRPDACFLARHPQVKDESAARNRLNRLGLLTSPSLRIEFPPRHAMALS